MELGTNICNQWTLLLAVTLNNVSMKVGIEENLPYSPSKVVNVNARLIASCFLLNRS